MKLGFVSVLGLLGLLVMDPSLASAAEPVIVAPAVTEGELSAAVIDRLETRLREVIRMGDLEIVDVSNNVGRNAAACADDTCRAKLIASSKAQFLLVPEITLDDADYRLRLTLYGPTGATTTRLDETCGLCGLVEAADVMSDLAARIGRKVDVATRTAVVVVHSDPPGAQVFVANALVGTTPFELPLDPGVHELHIELDGYISLERRFEAVAGESNRLELALQPRPTPIRPDRSKMFAGLGWTSIVAGLGAAAGGATLMLLDERPIQSDCSGANIDADGNCRWRYSTLEGGIGLVAGGAVLLGAGIALLVVARKRSKSSSSSSSKAARLQPAIGGFGVRF